MRRGLVDRAVRFALPAVFALQGLIAPAPGVASEAARTAGTAGTAPAAVATAGTSGAPTAQDGRTPKPVIAPARTGTQCVAPPEVMRREHPRMLKHQRDVTVHQGVRQARDSLQGCVGCHASQATGSVAQAPTDFCSSCHAYAAVKIDCFECHASRPGQPARPVSQAASAEPRQR